MLSVSAEHLGNRRRVVVDLQLVERVQRGVARAYARAYQPTFVGLDRIPDGAALLVGNHSGGIMVPDFWLLLAEYYRCRSCDDPLALLSHDIFFRLPLLGDLLRRLGGIPAERSWAESCLNAGTKVLVFPGGERESYRSWRERDRVDLGDRRGFIRLALRTGVPVVPVVSAGSHDGFCVLARGERLARWLQIRRLFRFQAAPIVLSIPWGLTFVAPLPYLPFPGTRVRTEFLPPIQLRGDPADPVTVARGYERIRAAMQEALTRLRVDLDSKRPFPA